MKIGLSSYSLYNALREGEMSFNDIVQWIASNGGEHMEAVAFLGDFLDNGFAQSVREKAEQVNLPISAYNTGVNVLLGQEQIELAYRHVDAANILGAKIMRCDLVDWNIPRDKMAAENFDRDLPSLIKGAALIADYAKQYGITITVENHGMYVNGGERVRRLIKGVNRENYRCTLDVGNALCIDENPIVCLETLLPFAAIIHFKDFYVRRDKEAAGEGFGIVTHRDYILRGAVVGHGDIDVRLVMESIKRHGYDGLVSIEFEGMEDCRTGSKIGMDNVRRLSKS